MCQVEGTRVTRESAGFDPVMLRVFDLPAGTPLGRFVPTERAANLCFGGRHRNRLFVAAAGSLYAVRVRVQGARPL